MQPLLCSRNFVFLTLLQRLFLSSGHPDAPAVPSKPLIQHLCVLACVCGQSRGGSSKTELCLQPDRSCQQGTARLPGPPRERDSAAPGDALSLGRPSLSPLSARSPWSPRRFTGGEDTKAIDLRQRFPPGHRSHGNHPEHPRGQCGPINHGRLPPGTGRPLLSPQSFRSVLGENSTLCPWSWSALERIFPSRWCVRGGRAGTDTPVSPALPPHAKTQLRNQQPVRSKCCHTQHIPTKLIFGDPPLLFPLLVSPSQSLAASRLITLSARLWLAGTAENI